MPAGRPSTYNDEIAYEICERIARGESVRAIGRDKSMPSDRAIQKWLTRHEDFVQQYAHAKKRYADAMFDECVEIADNCPPDNASVQKARLQIDTRKFTVGRINPQKYGESKHITQDVNVSGDITHLLGSIAGSTKTALPGQAEELAVEHVAPQQALEVEYAVVSDDADKGK
jgi:hypothetical protein